MRNNNAIVIDVESDGLDLLKSRLTCIAIKQGNSELVIANRSEKRMLRKFWNYLRKQENFVLVGFCIDSFDLPIIYARSMRHRIEVVDVRNKILDLRRLLSPNNRYAKGKLKDYCKLLRIGSKTGDGKKAVRLWKEGKISELREYVLQDVRITHKLFRRVEESGLI